MGVCLSIPRRRPATLVLQVQKGVQLLSGSAVRTAPRGPLCILMPAVYS